MRKFWALLKVMLINYLGISAMQIKDPDNRAKYLKKLGLGAIIVVALAPTIALYIDLLIKGFDLLAPIKQQGAILTLGIVVVSTVIFFFGIFYVMSFFYFATDTQNLLALPLSGWQVLGARFGVVLVYEYLTELPFLLPPILVYGIKSSVPITYWIFALIGYLLVPLLPLGLATVPTVFVMRFANLSKRKDLFRIVGAVVLIIVIMVYQFTFQKSGMNNNDPAFIKNLLTDQNGMVYLISRGFPSTRYLALSLINAASWAGLLYLLAFTGLSFLAVAVTWLVGDKLYFPGLIGSTETTAHRKSLTSSEYARLSKERPAVLSYCLKEIRLLLRTPTYFINCVMTNLLVPVILVIPFLIQSQSDQQLLSLAKLTAAPDGQIILMVILIGLIMFLVSTNSITATSISREGRQFYISKFMPISYREQILAKLLSAYVFGVIGAVLTVVIARLILPLMTVFIGMTLLVSLIAMIPVIEVGMLIDIYHPKLVWENEQQAFKQNLNVLFSMLSSIIIGGAIIFVVVKFTDSLAAAASFMLVSFGALGLIIYFALMRWGVGRYEELEG